MKNKFRILATFMGFSHNKTSHHEKLISGLGGFTGIFLVLITTQQIINADDAALVVASMGASAVLLFAVPHGPLSQPWALLGGHIVSAFVGVSCFLIIPDLYLAAATAVGLSITLMYYLRCIHPPGGATALSAVIAGPSVHALGYQFIVTPVLVNVLIIFGVAMLYNALFSWRRYPSILTHRAESKDQNKQPMENLGQIQLERALQKMNLLIDVSDKDLEKIFRLARNDNHGQLDIGQLKLGSYYSNGETGVNWSIRQIIDESDDRESEDSLVIYKTVAGKGRPDIGTQRRREFAQWAKYEVYLNEQNWERVLSPEYSE